MNEWLNIFARLGLPLAFCAVLLYYGGYGCGGSGVDSVTAPNARIEVASTEIAVGTALTLDGSGSLDLENDPLTYLWSATSGPYHVNLTNVTSDRATFTPETVGQHTFTLTVSDATQSGSTSITINVVGASGNSVYVNRAAAAGGDGSQGSPYNEIQTAIDATASPADIYVCEGTYDEARSGQKLLPSDGINLWGGFDCADWTRTFTAGGEVANESVIRANANDVAASAEDENSTYNLIEANGTISATVIDGFSIFGADSPTGSTCVIRIIAGGLTISNNTIDDGNSINNETTAIRCDGAGPLVIKNNTITIDGSMTTAGETAIKPAIYADALTADTTISWNRITTGAAGDLHIPGGVMGIYIEPGGGTLLIEGNTIELGANTASPVRTGTMAVIANWSGNAAIRKNKIYGGDGIVAADGNGMGSVGLGVMPAGSANVLIENNIISSGNGSQPEGGGGVGSSAVISGLTDGELTIINNTIFTSSDPGTNSVGILNFSGGGTTDVINNIIVTGAVSDPAGLFQMALVKFDTSYPFNRVLNNDIFFDTQSGRYPCGVFPTGGGNSTIAAGIDDMQENAANYGINTASGNVNVDPQFTDGTGFPTYELPSDSPLIDAGLSEGAPSEDYTGNPRPVGASPDIGAYEHQTE